MTQFHVRTWAVDLDGPLVEFLDDDHGVAWLHDEHGAVGFGTAAVIDGGVGVERFARLEHRFAALADTARIRDEVEAPGTGLVGFATGSFDPSSHGTLLVVPELIVGRGEAGGYVTRIGTSPPPSEPVLPPREPVSAAPVDRPRYAGASVPDVAWLEAVAAALQRIEAGRIDKVVLARDHAVWAKVAFSSRRLTARLRQRFPHCYTFVVDGFVGATPELLISRHELEVTSRVLAGSAPRDDDPAIDQQLAADLLASDKDRWEHELAVQTVRDSLRPFCANLDVEAEPHVLRLANVMHLGTWFRGRL
ncbi:MAG: chorismate-binding protein, partial [Nitriliruptorales bacterium]|nr:chorismate-binding protein [Nitriliruptorales bacterium]